MDDLSKKYIKYEQMVLFTPVATLASRPTARWGTQAARSSAAS